MLGVNPTNWGSVLLCRTGSVRHNLWLIKAAEHLGLKWKPHDGVLDAAGNIIASATEADIFAALHTDFVAPERRER
jgi:DNA polymerase/3'-5' exonuclease PolX